VTRASGIVGLRNTSALFARVSRNSERVIVPINDCALTGNTTLPAFYCVHDVTGGALADFVALALHLETSVRFYGVQLPPKKMQDVTFGGSIESIAEYYVDALSKFQQDGSLFVGGFCAGAIVALEIAQKMRAKGRDVRLLVAFDAVPENTSADLRPWNPNYLMGLARNLPGWFVHGGLKKQKDSHSLLRRFANNAISLGKVVMGRKPSEKMRGGFAIDSLMNLSRYPPDQRSFINRFYEACFAYFPKPYPDDIVLYEAKITPLLHLPQLASRWRGIAPRSQSVGISGTHLSMMREPHVGEMARDLGKRIASRFSEQPTPGFLPELN